MLPITFRTANTNSSKRNKNISKSALRGSQIPSHSKPLMNSKKISEISDDLALNRSSSINCHSSGIAVNNEKLFPSTTKSNRSSVCLTLPFK